jgi:hypothetical protein
MMKRLSIVAILLLAGCTREQQPLATFIPRPAPDDPTPAGIAYLCDGRKEVSVVYAKNRASVTLDGRTWRMEYQPTDGGFRYVDTANEWVGRDDLASLRESGTAKPIAFNCRPRGIRALSTRGTGGLARLFGGRAPLGGDIVCRYNVAPGCGALPANQAFNHSLIA